MPKKEAWYILCPRRHQVVAPLVEVHDTPEGILVHVKCKECAFPVPLTWEALSTTNWTGEDHPSDAEEAPTKHTGVSHG